MPITPATWNVDRNPSAGISVNPPASAPAIAPSVLAV
jgi:hypothetical protein